MDADEADNADGERSPKNAVIPNAVCGVEGSPIASGHRKLPIPFHLVRKAVVGKEARAGH
jgi:hypothetical protein